MSRVKEITTIDELDSEVAGHGRVVLLYGAVSWCAPCRALKPKYNEASDILDNTTFLYVDLDNPYLDQTLVVQNSVKGVPFMMKYYGSGTEKIDTTTLRSAKDIVERLQ